MAIVTGVVGAMSNKFDKFSIVVNDVWYSSKYEIACNRGDTVEFDDGDKKYCQRLKVVGSGWGAAAPSSGGSPTPRAAPAVGFPVGVNTKDRSIVRQNSLAHAARITAAELTSSGLTFDGGEAAAKYVVDMARIFEDYSAGDSDAAEAAEMMKGM